MNELKYFLKKISGCEDCSLYLYRCGFCSQEFYDYEELNDPHLCEFNVESILKNIPFPEYIRYYEKFLREKHTQFVEKIYDTIEKTDSKQKCNMLLEMLHNTDINEILKKFDKTWYNLWKQKRQNEEMKKVVEEKEEEIRLKKQKLDEELNEFKSKIIDLIF